MPDSSFDNTNETQQAQHTMSNDMPVDVNINSVVAREQAGTFTQLGKEFAASAARRDNIANAYMGKSMDKASA